MKKYILFSFFLFLVSAQKSFAGGLCSSSWNGIATKQEWLFNGTDGQPVSYCITRLPNKLEVNQIFNDCNNEYDSRDKLNEWVDSQKNRYCSQLNMEIKEDQNGMMLAYPIANNPSTETISEHNNIEISSDLSTDISSDNKASSSNLTLPIIVGALTLVIGILVKLLGFPDQFLKNYKRKSTEGLSSIFIILAFASYSLWTLHGFFQNDIVLIIGQGLGVLTTGAIVCQVVIYKPKK